jgi:hypothetical protein
MNTPPDKPTQAQCIEWMERIAAGEVEPARGGHMFDAVLNLLRSRDEAGQQVLAFVAENGLLDVSLRGAATALPVLFTMCSKLGFREGATVADEINAGVQTAMKELAHMRSLLPAPPVVEPIKHKVMCDGCKELRECVTVCNVTGDACYLFCDECTPDKPAPPVVEPKCATCGKERVVSPNYCSSAFHGQPAEQPKCEHRYIGKDAGAACPDCQPARTDEMGEALRAAHTEFRYLMQRRSFDIEDRERWRALFNQADAALAAQSGAK